ncbi:MAG: hypothetical protein ACOYK8_06965 [Alphaproteobacteria bacterium]
MRNVVPPVNQFSPVMPRRDAGYEAPPTYVAWDDFFIGLRTLLADHETAADLLEKLKQSVVRKANSATVKVYSEKGVMPNALRKGPTNGYIPMVMRGRDLQTELMLAGLDNRSAERLLKSKQMADGVYDLFMASAVIDNEDLVEVNIKPQYKSGFGSGDSRGLNQKKELNVAPPRMAGAAGSGRF